MSFASKIIIIASILFLGSTCRKKNVPDGYRFEEDAGTTKQSVEDRLKGTWIVNDFTFKGNSIFDALNKTTVVNPILANISLYYEPKSKENGWDEKLRLNPKGGANFFPYFTDSIKLSSTDTSLSYSLISPFKKNIKYILSIWKITMLYNGSMNLKMRTDTGDYKVFWKLKSR